MYIYHFESKLLQGQRRTIVSSWPIVDWVKLEALVNEDNDYLYENGWKLIKTE